MGRGVNGGHPVLDVFIKQWPSLIFLPAILGLIVVLVAVTRWWDQRDKFALRREGSPPSRRSRQAHPGRGDHTAAAEARGPTPAPLADGDPAATVHGTPSAPTLAIYPSVEHPPQVPAPMPHTHRGPAGSRPRNHRWGG